MLSKAARDAYRTLPGHKKRADEVDAWLADKVARQGCGGALRTLQPALDWAFR
jgi:hypothetical protein